MGFIHHECAQAELANENKRTGFFDVIEDDGEFYVVDQFSGMRVAEGTSVKEASAEAWELADQFDYGERVAFLKNHGFVVGAREPRLNTRFDGKFMVADSYEESDLPTDDGSRIYCIVGDDLRLLVKEAYERLVDMTDAEA